MDQKLAKPGDVLIHHDTGFVSDIEAWGEWDGLPGQDLKATHGEAQFDAVQIVKMNPKVSCLYQASTAPWPTMTGLYLDLTSLGIPILPRDNPFFVINFQAECNLHLGEPYGWSAIGEAVGVGLLSRVWPWAADRILKSSDWAGHDCTVWLTDRINAAVSKTYGKPDFELFDDKLDSGRVRPADMQTSPYLKPIKA